MSASSIPGVVVVLLVHVMVIPVLILVLLLMLLLHRSSSAPPPALWRGRRGVGGSVDLQNVITWLYIQDSELTFAMKVWQQVVKKKFC